MTDKLEGAPDTEFSIGPFVEQLTALLSSTLDKSLIFAMPNNNGEWHLENRDILEAFAHIKATARNEALEKAAKGLDKSVLILQMHGQGLQRISDFEQAAEQIRALKADTT